MLHVNMNESESMKSLADIPMHTHAQEVLDFDWLLQAMVFAFDWLLQAMVVGFDWLLQAMVLGFDWLLQAIVLIGCCRLWWHEPVDRGPQQG